MGTLQSGDSPGQRIKAGSTVLDRSKSVDVRPVKKKLDALRAVQKDYEAAHTAAGKAVAALVAQERVLGGLDEAQDASIETWAAARVGAGAKRTQPFGDIGGPAPSNIQRMDTLKEAALIGKLAAKDKKHSDARVKKTAAAADAAAKAVIAATKPIAGLARARNAAIAARDAIGPRWEKAFSALKRAARAAEDDGATGLFVALFDAPSRAPKKKAPPAPQPAETNGAATA
jgi:hypothetical protein